MRQNSTGDRLRRRLTEVRKRRGLSQADLSGRLSDVGVTVHPTAVAKIERGTRAVTIDEVLALAYVLGVSPTNLLLPTGDADPVEVTPRVSELAIWVRDWIAGEGPLPSQAGGSESERRHATDDYFREAPEREQLNRQVAMHPLMLTLNGELGTFARDGILLTQGARGSIEPRVAIEPHLLAAALRDSAHKVSTYVELLASQLENTDTGHAQRDGD